MLSFYMKEESSLILKVTVSCDKPPAPGFLMSLLRGDVSEQEMAGISVKGQMVYLLSAGQTASSAALTLTLHSWCRNTVGRGMAVFL